jgi:hypothetical protein
LPAQKWRTEVRRYNGYVKVEYQARDKTNCNGCPVPRGGTGRYQVNCFDSLRNLFADT